MSLPIADESSARERCILGGAAVLSALPTGGWPIIRRRVAGARGALALWIGLGTEGYLSDMVVRNAP